MLSEQDTYLSEDLKKFNLAKTYLKSGLFDKAKAKFGELRYSEECGKLATLALSLCSWGVKNIEVTDVFIDIKYETVYGIEIKDNILCYYGTDTDWFVDLDVKTSKWSENNINTNTHVDIIESSNADGIINTKEIANKDNSSICYKAMTRVFEKGVIGYIPSYIEMELFSDYLNEINEYLQSKQLPLIDLNNCWTSETFDEKNAWTSDGIYVGKGENLKYYIFGKRIIL